MAELIWLNGALCSPQGAIDARDRGFTLGDGVFETMFWTGRKVRGFQRHLARLAQGCAGLFLPPPPVPADIAVAIASLIEANGLNGRTAAIRLTVTRGPAGRGLALPPDVRPTILITAGPFSPSTETLKVCLSGMARHPGNPSTRFKTLAYVDAIIALQQAREQGCDDALMFGPGGRIACASAGNILIVTRDGMVVTPPLSDGALAGTTRGALLHKGLIQQGPVTLDALLDAQSVMIANALHGLRRVAMIQGSAEHVIADGGRSYPKAHPVFDRLIEALSADDD